MIPKNIDNLVDIIHGILSILSESYFEFKIVKLTTHILQFQVNKCFAFEGMKKLGLISKYECGIYDRVEGWFEGLDIKYINNDNFSGCLMHRDGI